MGDPVGAMVTDAPVEIEVNRGIVAVPAPGVLTAERVTITGVEVAKPDGHEE